MLCGRRGPCTKESFGKSRAGAQSPLRPLRVRSLVQHVGEEIAKTQV